VTAEVPVAGRPPATAVSAAATRSSADVLSDVRVVDGEGLTPAEAATRLASSGPNAVVSHRVGAWSGQLHQLRSPLLGLLVVAAVAYDAVGEQSDAGDHRGDRRAVGRARLRQRVPRERAAEALHSGIRHHAADVILLDKDLDVLADGVTEGRRIFANTLKYVLMGTSSNFGNMFSAAGASLPLSFLPMVIFAIRTRRFPFFRSHPSIPLVLAALGVVAVVAVPPSTPLAHALGSRRSRVTSPSPSLPWHWRTWW
jgi:magnesium-transporting ATPase (P-type)